jgi:DNA (cytosine-5)-methyltransferase 1
MPIEFAIVDLFAGPGGLAEGFSSLRNEDGSRPFRIALSVEKEASAFETLRLRSFFRQFGDGAPPDYYRFLNGEVSEPDWASLFPTEWKRACLETAMLELGSKSAAKNIDARLDEIIQSHRGDVILIGGPPCQAYSLVGRARNKGVEGYEASKDLRHFLYQEYIRILQRLMPAAFVMENVKGLLSSSIDGERVFDQVLRDLRKVGNGSYRLVPLAPRSGQPSFGGMINPPAADFVVRAEDHGIPQSRHRVIIVGIRDDVAAGLDDSQINAALLTRSESPVTVENVLKGMPKLRSGLSKGDDSEAIWKAETSRIMRDVAKTAIGLFVSYFST